MIFIEIHRAVFEKLRILNFVRFLCLSFSGIENPSHGKQFRNHLFLDAKKNFLSIFWKSARQDKIKLGESYFTNCFRIYFLTFPINWRRNIFWNMMNRNSSCFDRGTELNFCFARRDTGPTLSGINTWVKREIDRTREKTLW